MILDTILNKRVSLNDPKIKLSDPRIIELLDSGAKSSSGAHVNERTALGVPAYWRGVNLISRTVGKVPVLTYRRLRDSGRSPDDFHPATWLLRHQPNQDMTPMVFKMTMTAHALHHGNGFAFIARNDRMEPEELIPLLPDRTKVERVGSGYEYVTRTDSNVEFRIAPENILHIKGLSCDGIVGYAIIDILREALGHAIALQQYGAIFFKNAAKPSVVIKLPPGQSLKTQEAVERLRTSWGNVHGGLENSHKPAILENGADVSPLTITNEQAQFLESQKFSLVDIANILGLPPHKVGDATRTSFASLEQENQSFLDDAMDPWFVTWEEECERKLLRESERIRDSRFIEFMRQALVRADLDKRVASYNTAIQGGWMSRDEVRAKENMNPIPGGEGAKYFVPLNVGVLGPDGLEVPAKDESPPAEDNEPAEEPDDEQPRSVLVTDAIRQQRKLFDATSHRFVRRIAEGAKRAAKKPKQFNDWIDRFLVADHRQAMYDQLSPVVSTVRLLTVGSTGNATEMLVNTWFVRVQHDLNEITGHVTAEELEQRVTLYFDSEPCAIHTYAAQLFGDLENAVHN